MQTKESHLKLVEKNFFFSVSSFFFFSGSFSDRVNMLIASFSDDHFHHSSFGGCSFSFLSLSLMRLYFLLSYSHTIDNWIADDPNICLYLARQREREIYHSTPPPILFIVVLLSAQSEREKEVDLRQIVFHLLNRCFFETCNCELQHAWHFHWRDR